MKFSLPTLSTLHQNNFTWFYFIFPLMSTYQSSHLPRPFKLFHLFFPLTLHLPAVRFHFNSSSFSSPISIKIISVLGFFLSTAHFSVHPLTCFQPSFSNTPAATRPSRI